MATLKDHQQAMVDLLASGSGIPASASRLAHAMHDVLGILLLQSAARENATDIRALFGLDDATTPGLNDKALAADVEACRPKATPAERRVKELENTVRQLRASNAKLREKQTDVIGEVHKWSIDRCLAGRANYTDMQNLIIDAYVGLEPEQAGCRKPDTQICVQVSDHDFAVDTGFCVYCGKHYREVTK
ncbi:hypothetical protein SAY60_002912 [Salmonella enterica]|nr:hypothetical protein [Salmonella enterica]